MVTIRPRSAWGARAPDSVTSRPLSYWRGVRVHHSATSSDASIAGIQRYHMDTKGWPDIGYNFLVQDGQVWTGRGWSAHPAHDGVNDTLGVCMVGDYRSALPSDEDMDALVGFVVEARRRTGVHLPVDGHRDASGASTVCPGDRLHAELPAIRRRADADEDEEDTMDMSQRVELNPWAQRKFDLDDIALSTALGSGYAHARAGKYAIQDAREEILAGQAAILAKLGGGDDDTVRQAIRGELVKHRAALVDALADDLAEDVAGQLSDVPADQVTAAVQTALERVRLRVESDGDGS